MTSVRTLDDIRSRIDRLVGVRDACQRNVVQTKKDIKALETEGDLLALVQAALRGLIDKEVTSGVQTVERLLTEGLQTVFSDQNLSVKSEVSVSRGKVSVNLLTHQTRADGTVIQGLSNDAFGGAVATVQSVLLRILVMRRRGLRPFLLLDESLPAFDSNYVHNMGSFLSLVCERLKVDILLVTHNPAMVEAANKSYRIVRTKAGARFEALR